MKVKRIQNFNLPHRPLFSGIYGPGVKDDYVGADLKRYGIWEMLFLTFRSQGYNVVFYSQDPGRNFFSFRKDDLVELFGLRRSTSAQAENGRYTANISSPFAGRRRRNAPSSALPSDDPETYSQIQERHEGTNRAFYRIANSVDPFTTISHYISEHPERKMVFIFNSAATDVYDHPESILPQLNNLKTTFNSTNCQAHIISLYDVETFDTLFCDDARELFRGTFFKDTLTGVNPTAGKGNQLYYIAGPGRDEYRNLLNRRRLLDGYSELMDGQGIEEKAVRLSQEVTRKNRKDDMAYVGEVEMLSYYVKMPLDKLKETIEKMSKERSIDRLRSMAGTEKLVEQIEAYIETLKDSRTNQSGARFRPHLVFSGNPGTGKTTVARLLADILREEGLLERGHLIEATVGDLEGEYVGQTRIKTQALCDRARGGVLFIDEAYGLISGGHGNHVDYGKEAIEVLIQFMENNADSLVILAGYKSDMENLIKNGNQGFMGRFNGKESFIDFKDYNENELYTIFQRQIKGYETTNDFDDSIRRIISYMFVHKNARWSNAREMEKLSNTILGIHRRKGKQKILHVDDIPKDKMRLISDKIDHNKILTEINSLIGLDEVKENLSDLLLSTLGRRIEAQRLGEIDMEKPNLNFVFEGNPGTGKTTVAKHMAKILYELGLIDDITPAEIDSAALVNSGVGDTPKAIEQMFKDHSGKVIFIDEAYSLGTHGTDAIDAITKSLTDKRFEGNQALILAGYTDDMERLMSMNDGMRRRFKNIWHFADYSNEELWEIMMRTAKSKGFSFDPEDECRMLAFEYFDTERTRGSQFGNAGLAVGFFDTLRRAYERKVVSGASGRILRPEYYPGYKGKLSSVIDCKTDAVQQVHLANRNIATTSNHNVRGISLNDNIENSVSDVSHFTNAVGLVTGSKGMGTGFFISLNERLVLTASHVIEGNSDILFIMDRGTTAMGAKVLWNNPKIDMAILKCESIPSDARYFKIDSDINVNPKVLERILHCGFLKGTNVSTNFSTYEGVISNYDPRKQIAERCFDAIISGIEATNGCSGGPVMRATDFTVIGVMQGGFSEAPARIISDIHQLYKQKTLKIE